MPGYLMRRGSILLDRPPGNLSPSFVACGAPDSVFSALVDRHLISEGILKQPLLGTAPCRYGGDNAVLGLGEILLPALSGRSPKNRGSFWMTRWQLAHGRHLDLGAKSVLMGILNVTPDSFSDGGEFNTSGRRAGAGADDDRRGCGDHRCRRRIRPGPAPSRFRPARNRRASCRSSKRWRRKAAL